MLYSRHFQQSFLSKMTNQGGVVASLVNNHNPECRLTTKITYHLRMKSSEEIAITNPLKNPVKITFSTREITVPSPRSDTAPAHPVFLSMRRMYSCFCNTILDAIPWRREHPADICLAGEETVATLGTHYEIQRNICLGVCKVYEDYETIDCSYIAIVNVRMCGRKRQ